jgi:hypothetical protein
MHTVAISFDLCGGGGRPLLPCPQPGEATSAYPFSIRCRRLPLCWGQPIPNLSLLFLTSRPKHAIIFATTSLPLGAVLSAGEGRDRGRGRMPPYNKKASRLAIARGSDPGAVRAPRLPYPITPVRPTQEAGVSFRGRASTDHRFAKQSLTNKPRGDTYENQL